MTSLETSSNKRFSQPRDLQEKGETKESDRFVSFHVDPMQILKYANIDQLYSSMSFTKPEYKDDLVEYISIYVAYVYLVEYISIYAAYVYLVEYISIYVAYVYSLE